MEAVIDTAVKGLRHLEASPSAMTKLTKRNLLNLV